MNELTIRNLSFNYGERKILKNINLTFKEKRVTGIMGMNGCGKSTLLKNIIHFLTPMGEVKFNEKNIAELSPKERAAVFGFIPQKSQIAEGFTVEEIITMGRVSQLKNSWKGLTVEDYSRVKKQIELFKIQKFKDKDIGKLSGGEQQRVLLARAMVNEPDVLILDEPTSALDIHYSIEMLGMIKNIVREKSLICLVVLHDLNLASLFCDDIVFMKEGEVLYHDRADTLLKEEIFQEIYNFRCSILEKDGVKYILPKIQEEQ